MVCRSESQHLLFEFLARTDSMSIASSGSALCISWPYFCSARYIDLDHGLIIRERHDSSTLSVQSGQLTDVNDLGRIVRLANPRGQES